MSNSKITNLILANIANNQLGVNQYPVARKDDALEIAVSLNQQLPGNLRVTVVDFNEAGFRAAIVLNPVNPKFLKTH
jgi:hypothetical protein